MQPDSLRKADDDVTLVQTGSQSGFLLEIQPGPNVISTWPPPTTGKRVFGQPLGRQQQVSHSLFGRGKQQGDIALVTIGLLLECRRMRQLLQLPDITAEPSEPPGAVLQVFFPELLAAARTRLSVASSRPSTTEEDELERFSLLSGCLAFTVSAAQKEGLTVHSIFPGRHVTALTREESGTGGLSVRATHLVPASSSSALCRVNAGTGFSTADLTSRPVTTAQFEILCSPPPPAPWSLAGARHAAVFRWCLYDAECGSVPPAPRGVVARSCRFEHKARRTSGM